MTIFHVLKYPVTSITSRTELDALPEDVIVKWRRRMTDYAIDAAKPVVHLDKTGKAQKCIDAIYLYRDGKITIDKLKTVGDTAYYAYYEVDAIDDVTAYAVAAAYAAYAANAANAAYAVAYAADAAVAADAAGKTAADATKGEGRNKVREESYSSFKKWLIEELNNYEGLWIFS